MLQLDAKVWRVWSFIEFDQQSEWGGLACILPQYRQLSCLPGEVISRCCSAYRISLTTNHSKDWLDYPDRDPGESVHCCTTQLWTGHREDLYEKASCLLALVQQLTTVLIAWSSDLLDSMLLILMWQPSTVDNLGCRRDNESWFCLCLWCRRVQQAGLLSAMTPEILSAIRQAAAPQSVHYRVSQTSTSPCSAVQCRSGGRWLAVGQYSWHVGKAALQCQWRDICRAGLLAARSND